MGSFLFFLLFSTDRDIIYHDTGMVLTVYLLQVFQDNCCKRELLNLEVYCSNTPACTQKVPLCNLQVRRLCVNDTLQPNPNCTR